MSAICLISIVSVSILIGFFVAREICSEIYKSDFYKEKSREYQKISLKKFTPEYVKKMESEYLSAYNKLEDVNNKIELAEKKYSLLRIETELMECRYAMVQKYVRKNKERSMEYEEKIYKLEQEINLLLLTIK